MAENTPAQGQSKGKSIACMACGIASIVDCRVHQDNIQPVMSNSAGFPDNGINMILRISCLQDIKFRDVDNDEVRNLPEGVALLRISICYHGSVQPYPLQVVVVVGTLHLDVALMAVPQSA